MAEPIGVTSPCTSWFNPGDDPDASGEDVFWCCPEVLPLSASPCPPDSAPCEPDPVLEREQFALIASEVLWAASGFLFPGICEATTTYTPRCESCELPINVCCCADCVDPVCLGPLTVHYPLIEVVSITEDGVDLNLTTAGVKIQSNKNICRTDGNRWESCDTVIEYTYGRTPPWSGRLAAAKLACELSKACTGEQACIPQSATNYSAGGSTISKPNLIEELAEGRIPIPEVAVFLMQWGVAKSQRYVGQVFSPDLKRANRLRTWTG